MLFIITALTVWSLVRFLQTDTLLEPARDRWLDKTNPFITELVTCAWCLSFWVAAVVTAGLWAAGRVDWVAFILWPWAIRVTVGVLDTAEHLIWPADTVEADDSLTSVTYYPDPDAEGNTIT